MPEHLVPGHKQPHRTFYKKRPTTSLKDRRIEDTAADNNPEMHVLECGLRRDPMRIRDSECFHRNTVPDINLRLTTLLYS